MTRGMSTIRLLTAVTVLFAACKFVNVYSQLSDTRFKFDHPDGHTSRFNEFVLANGGWAYAVPFALLLVGIAIVWRWPRAQPPIELVVSTLWLVASGWFAITLLSWQMQNIPVFHGMQSHY